MNIMSTFLQKKSADRRLAPSDAYKRMYAQKIQNGYNDIVTIAEALAHLKKRAAQNQAIDPDEVDNLGQSLAEFSKLYSKVTTDLLDRV